MFVHQVQLIAELLGYGYFPDTKSVDACLTAEELRLASASKHARITSLPALSERLHVCIIDCDALNPQDICWRQCCECGRLPCNGSASC